MKRLILAIFSAGLLLLPIAANAGSDSGSASAPPISQALVREGDYAVELVTALNIGSVEDETQAEDILAAAGVAPNSGWISNFPVTPDIIAEIKASIDTAADAGKLPMGREDAEKAFFAMNNEIGLSITPAASAEPAKEQPAPYNEPAVINNYYYDEGPPVVTYYAPPPDYLYLYAWDPFPFWCNGFYFPGFFVLSDFNFVFFDDFDHHGHHHDGHHDGHHHDSVTNHVTDPISHRSVTVDPVSKRPLAQTAFRPIGARGSFDPIAKTGGTRDRRVVGNINRGSFDRTSASNLLGRSINRPATGSGTWSRDRAITPATRSGTQWVRTEPGTSRVAPSRSGSFNAGADRGFNRPSSGFNRSSGDRLNAPARSFNRPATFQGRSYSAPPVSSGRSINAPSSGGWGRMTEVGRSFGGGGGRSFSAPSGGGRSFSAPSGGGGRSFGGGGFGGGGRSFSAPSGGGGRSFSAPSGGGGHSFGGGGGMRGR